MKTRTYNNSISSKSLKWVARIICTLYLLVYGTYVIAFMIEHWEKGGSFIPDGLLGRLFMITVLVAISVIWAWWKKLTGGILLILSFAIFCIDFYPDFEPMISSLPFLISGILFIISWYQGKHSLPKITYNRTVSPSIKRGKRLRSVLPSIIIMMFFIVILSLNDTSVHALNNTPEFRTGYDNTDTHIRIDTLQVELVTVDINSITNNFQKSEHHNYYGDTTIEHTWARTIFKEKNDNTGFIFRYTFLIAKSIK